MVKISNLIEKLNLIKNTHRDLKCWNFSWGNENYPKLDMWQLELLVVQNPSKPSELIVTSD